MTDGGNIPAQRTTPEEVLDLEAVLSECGHPMTGEDLVRRGGRYRLVDRTRLMKEVLRLVEVFVDDRVRQAESQLRGLLDKREEEAREEGRMRVLVSLVELADLVDSIVGSIDGGSGASAAKALDKRLDRVFRSYGFDRVSTVGQEFDPAIHEALEERADAEVPSSVIVEELSRGYRRGSYVLRVARVIVAV